MFSQPSHAVLEVSSAIGLGDNLQGLEINWDMHVTGRDYLRQNIFAPLGHEQLVRFLRVALCREPED